MNKRFALLVPFLFLSACGPSNSADQAPQSTQDTVAPSRIYGNWVSDDSPIGNFSVNLSRDSRAVITITSLEDSCTAVLNADFHLDQATRRVQLTNVVESEPSIEEIATDKIKRASGRVDLPICRVRTLHLRADPFFYWHQGLQSTDSYTLGTSPVGIASEVVLYKRSSIRKAIQL